MQNNRLEIVGVAALVVLAGVHAYEALPPIGEIPWLVVFAGIVAAVEVMRFLGIGPGRNRRDP